MHQSLVFSLLPFVLSGAAFAAPSPTSFDTECAKLANSLALPDYPGFKVNFAKFVSGGTELNLTADGVDASCLQYPRGPIPVDLCRVSLMVPTSSKGSRIFMEAWLPKDWNGRFLAVGNGNTNGCVQYADLSFGTQNKFATIGTDNGHNGTSAASFYNAPDVLEDFVYRALYTGTVVGKDVVKQFYKESHRKSYYTGCSAGGRLGWKAVQDFPEQFDGVVTGAPVINWNGQGSLQARAFKLLARDDPTAPTYITSEQFALLHEEVLRQCDHLDGATDGIVDDTLACRLDYKPILCSNNSTSPGCLSSVQADAIRKLYAPWIVNGTMLHPGVIYNGAEQDLQFVVYAPGAEVAIEEWFQYVISGNLNWTWHQFTDADALASYEANVFNIQTWEGDLSAFRDRGSKVLHWHGQADPAITVSVSDQYYEHVGKTMNATSEELDEFYRYFRAGGVSHCGGGPGPFFLGFTYGLDASADPEDNMLSRIVAWVEDGQAPETIRGTKFVNDDPTQGVAYRRKQCKHPKVNHYFGTGNGTDEEGWRCVEREASA
ncbi:tannase and feruloyl esterase [Polyplosphaeria fusca]|uniref:Carboxylic ester hydrolase n=1 Tax=Polyplosphaeria fusca TaxID=682080 RepID=A0A9P4QVS5_9PLEO|nr:tannase and feruloyl esterase [Polyplosphaeria fusca]